MKGQFPWIGRSRGSAGGMTTCKINDKNVMRAKAFEVTNPKTAAQVMQRDFFKQVQEVCASVTEDQLRSLFGVKPKTMTRRNALSKQIASAYTITDGVKSVDFSNLLAIGNGEKVTTPFVKVTDNTITDETLLTQENFGEGTSLQNNLIFVMFNTDNNSIVIANTNLLIEEEWAMNDLNPEQYGMSNGYMYVTTSNKNVNVYNDPFGTFTIKTRATD